MTDGSPDAERVLESVDGPILLFDGVCNLCNGVVRFVVAHERAARVRFAPLDSPVGQALLARFDLPRESFDSVVFIERGRVYQKSEAALRLVRYLDPPWSLAALGRVLPRTLRDAVYDLVADTRYRVFGRKDRCPIPDPETRERFLDGAFADRTEIE